VSPSKRVQKGSLEKDDVVIPQHSSDRAHNYSLGDPYFFFLAVLLYLNDHSRLTKMRLFSLVNNDKLAQLTSADDKSHMAH